MSQQIISMKKFREKSDKQPVQKEDDKIDLYFRSAQSNGYIELQKYETLVNNFIKDVAKLAVFENIMKDVLSEQIRYFLIDEVLKSLVKPIFEGESLPFMKDEDYDEIRKNMYRSLIERYVQIDKDGPFD